MSEKFKAPETYEEAVARKEALLEKINQYNEEYFKGNTSVNEEEIALVQEEYEFLDELKKKYLSQYKNIKFIYNKSTYFNIFYHIFLIFHRHLRHNSIFH